MCFKENHMERKNENYTKLKGKKKVLHAIWDPKHLPSKTTHILKERFILMLGNKYCCMFGIMQ